MISGSTPSTTKRPNKLHTTYGLAAAALIVVVVTGILQARVALTAQDQSRLPLTVATAVFQPQTAYTRQVSYLGLVTAGRKANLGFEFPGLIASLPVREGSPVQKGQQIAALDTSALESRRRATSAQLDQAKAELELAELKSQRQQKLADTGAVSKEAYDETRLRARALTSQLEAVSAALASIDIELGKAQLLAPYDGVVADRYVYEGAVVGAGTPVVRLVELASQEAHIGVPAKLAATLVPGKQHTLTLRELRVEAELLSIRPDIDPITRTTSVVFLLPPDANPLDGEPITLELEEPVPMAGGWLPMSALLEGQRGTWTVLRLEQEEEIYRAVRESVEVLEVQADQVYVRGTLSAGDTVVANGVHKITPGTLVVLAEGH